MWAVSGPPEPLTHSCPHAPRGAAPTPRTEGPTRPGARGRDTFGHRERPGAAFQASALRTTQGRDRSRGAAGVTARPSMDPGLVCGPSTGVYFVSSSTGPLGPHSAPGTPTPGPNPCRRVFPPVSPEITRPEIRL